MELITEIQSSTQKILIVDREASPTTSLLKKTLAARGADVYFSSRIPQTTDRFDLLFLINVDPAKIPFHKITSPFLNLLVIENKKAAEKIYNRMMRSRLEAKLVHLPYSATPEDVDRMLWFILSKGGDRFLNLVPSDFPPRKTKKAHSQSYKNVTPRLLITILLALFMTAHIALLPLQFTTFYLLVHDKPGGAAASMVSRFVYRATHTTYAFFSAALLPDRMNDINDRVPGVPVTTSRIKNTTALVGKIGEKGEYLPKERELLTDALSALSRDLQLLEDDAGAISEKLPDFPKSLIRYKKQFDEKALRAQTAHILTEAAKEYLALGEPVPSGLLAKLTQVVSGL